MQDVWKGPGVCRPCPVRVQCSGTNKVFVATQRSTQNEVIPSWYSPTQPKPFYENEQATVYWDVPAYADHTEVQAKEKEKTFKYAPLRLELKQQYPGYKINQVNIIIDVLGGYSKELYSSVRDLLGAERSRECLRRMQKSVLSSSLNIARSFKVLS